MLESGGSGIILKPQHDKSLAPWSSEVAVSTLDDDSEDDELEKLMGETFAANCFRWGRKRMLLYYMLLKINSYYTLRHIRLVIGLPQ